jgi:hypothetical protein
MDYSLKAVKVTPAAIARRTQRAHATSAAGSTVL